MVLNRGGNKGKRGARKNFRKKTYSLNDLKPSEEDNQQYGYVTEKYGDGRFQVICYDKVSRLAIVRGTIKKKTRLVAGGFVLLSMRDFEDAKCDIVYVYTDEDIEKLIKSNSVEESFAKEGKLSAEQDFSTIEEETNAVNDIADIKSYGSNEEWCDEGDTINTVSSEEKPLGFVAEMGFDEIDIDDI